MSGAGATTLWARTFVEELVRAGVREACVAPGSRSTPLVLALARHDGIDAFAHFDERSAAFFAVGLARSAGRPAAVVTTSGTATANLYPAVLEAEASGTPLLLLTADRPRRLRGTDANQTTDQAGLYGAHVRLFHDVTAPATDAASLRYIRALAGRALSAATGPPGGPVHLNFPFDKPLEPPAGEDLPRGAPQPEDGDAGRPDGRSWTRVGGTSLAPDPGEVRGLVERLAGVGRGLIVGGAHSGPRPPGEELIRLARRTGWPLLADPLSGARFAPGAPDVGVDGYDLFLRDPETRAALVPEVVLRFGAAPTSAAAATYLEEHVDAEQIAFDAGPAWPDHVAAASACYRVDARAAAGDLADAWPGPDAPAPDRRSSWGRLWSRCERRTVEAVEAELEGPPFEGSTVASVTAALEDGSRLFVGSSMPVRDLDAFGRSRHESVRVLGNRGVSGIDGSVSTALGAAAAGGPTVGVLGDLALLHDVNGLHPAADLGLDVVLVVLQNDGGGIFHMLPVREHEPAFTPYFATPHGRDVADAARLYGWEHRRLAEEEDPGAAVREALEEGGLHLLEVRSDREANRRRHEEVAAAVRAALAD